MRRPCDMHPFKNLWSLLSSLAAAAPRIVLKSGATCVSRSWSRRVRWPRAACRKNIWNLCRRSQPRKPCTAMHSGTSQALIRDRWSFKCLLLAVALCHLCPSLHWTLHPRSISACDFCHLRNGGIRNETPSAAASACDVRYVEASGMESPSHRSTATPLPGSVPPNILQGMMNGYDLRIEVCNLEVCNSACLYKVI